MSKQFTFDFDAADDERASGDSREGEVISPARSAEPEEKDQPVVESEEEQETPAPKKRRRKGAALPEEMDSGLFMPNGDLTPQLRERYRAAETCADNAGGAFKSAYQDFVMNHARRGEPFTNEDIKALYEALDYMPMPHDWHSTGAVIVGLSKKKLLYQIGSKKSKVGSNISVWSIRPPVDEKTEMIARFYEQMRKCPGCLEEINKFYTPRDNHADDGDRSPASVSPAEEEVETALEM